MDNDEYWRVDLPGLTEAGARELLELISTSAIDGADYAFSSSPRGSYNRGFDHATVEAVVVSLRCAVAECADRSGIVPSVIEDMEHWLSWVEKFDNN